MVQRVRIPHRGTSPSSVTQLPILTALHARFPTLFGPIIHHLSEKVNTYFHFPETCLRNPGLSHKQLRGERFQTRGHGRFCGL